MDRREDQQGDGDSGEEVPSSGGQDQEPSGDPEATDEATDGVKAEWKRVNEFGINTKMREIVKLTIEASEDELARLRKKLEQLQYGG